MAEHSAGTAKIGQYVVATTIYGRVSVCFIQNDRFRVYLDRSFIGVIVLKQDAKIAPFLAKSVLKTQSIAVSGTQAVSWLISQQRGA